MKKSFFYLNPLAFLLLIGMIFTNVSCSDDDDDTNTPEIKTPNLVQTPVPSDGNTDVQYNNDGKIEFGWEYIEEEGYGVADSFRVLMGSQTNTSGEIVDPFVKSVVHTPGQTIYDNIKQHGLANGSTWYWQVVPFNTDGDAENAVVWTFTTTGMDIPNAAQNPVPSDGNNDVQYNIDGKIEFGWEYIEEAGYAVADSFRVLMGNQTNTSGEIIDPFVKSVVHTSGQTTYNNIKQHGLAHGSTWYWQVIPFTADGDAENTVVWSFTTAESNVPNAVQSPVPTDGDTNVQYNVDGKIEFGWEYIEEAGYAVADSFRVLMGDQIDTFGEIVDPFVKSIEHTPGQTTYNNIKQHGLANGSTWYWQVIPFNTEGDAENTVVWMFTTAN